MVSWYWDSADFAKELLMSNDYISVTEIAGDEVTQEQVDRLCNRYYWAGQMKDDQNMRR